MQIDVARQAVAQAQGHLKDVSAAHASGAASKADVLAVESQVASAELLLTRARSATVNTEQRVRTLMHDTSGSRYEVGEDLREPSSLTDVQDSLHQPVPALVQEALSRRLEPRALLEGAGAARAQAGAQRAAGLPRLDAVGNAYYSRPNQRIFPLEDRFRGSWDAGLQLSWSPTDIFGDRGRPLGRPGPRPGNWRRSARCWPTASSWRSRRPASRCWSPGSPSPSAARALAAAEESYRVRRALFQNGRATSVELTDAETERSRAQLEAIATRIDQRIAEARLKHALGRDVETVEK